jgi:hypothetical protein
MFARAATPSRGALSCVLGYETASLPVLLEKYYMAVWIGFIWLRIGTGGGAL